MELNQKSRMKQNAKWMISSVAFLCLVVFLTAVLGTVFMDKSGSSNVISLYDKDAQYDVVLTGTSHVVSSLYPMEMWASHGITSCNYAQTGQMFGITYYAIKEAIDVARPKLIVCDLYYAYISSKTSGNTSYKHQSLDNMRFLSPYRIGAIFDLIPHQEKMDFLFPFFSFHSRWNSLTMNDFIEATSLTKGASENFWRVEVPFAEGFAPVDRNDTKKPAQHVLDYVDAIIKACKESGTQLLFTVVPYYPQGTEQGRALEDDQRIFNYITDYVEAQGIECLNMLYHLDDMGFDMDAHMREWNHQNYWGGVVTSTYLAEYIQENYGIADHRNETGFEQWDADWKVYDAWCQKELKNFNQKK